VLDGANVLRDEVTESGESTVYVHGPLVDEVLSRESANEEAYYHGDALGSIVTVSDPAGAPEQSFSYTSWGEPESEIPEGEHAFAGREWEAASRTVFMRARYYEPSTGRFLNEDPVGAQGGTNWYAYALNNVPGLRDPTGLVAWQCDFFVGAAGYIAAAGTITLTCVSECVDDKEVWAIIKGVGLGYTAGLKYIPGDAIWGRITLEDGHEVPDVDNLTGSGSYYSVGYTVGNKSGGDVEITSGDGKGKAEDVKGVSLGSTGFKSRNWVAGGPVERDCCEE
jgi:RHS repeat-associated protein